MNIEILYRKIIKKNTQIVVIEINDTTLLNVVSHVFKSIQGEKDFGGNKTQWQRPDRENGHYNKEHKITKIIRTKQQK